VYEPRAAKLHSIVIGENVLSQAQPSEGWMTTLVMFDWSGVRSGSAGHEHFPL